MNEGLELHCTVMDATPGIDDDLRSQEEAEEAAGISVRAVASCDMEEEAVSLLQFCQVGDADDAAGISQKSSSREQDPRRP